MRLAALYVVYIGIGLYMLAWLPLKDLPPIPAIMIATIWLYTLAWASNYTYVKWLGKLFRRQHEKDQM
jgi:hypothetical protein